MIQLPSFGKQSQHVTVQRKAGLDSRITKGEGDGWKGWILTSDVTLDVIDMNR